MKALITVTLLVGFVTALTIASGGRWPTKPACDHPWTLKEACDPNGHCVMISRDCYGR